MKNWASEGGAGQNRRLTLKTRVIVRVLLMLSGVASSWALASDQVSMRTKLFGSLSGEASSSVFDNIARTVIRLEVRKTSDPTQAPLAMPAGTGFLVVLNDELYLVTAQHVTETTTELWARIPVRHGQQLDVAELQIPRDAWVRHGQEKHRVQKSGSVIYVGAADVAATRLTWPAVGQLDVLTLCIDTADCATGSVAVMNPRPPERILSLGFPDWLGFELEIQRPLLRSGVVALATVEPTLRYLGGKLYAPAGSLALDIRSFAGNSGSPAFRETDITHTPTLVGLISSGDESLDFAIAEPASRIIETVLAAETTVVSNPPSWTTQARSSAQANTVD